MTTVNITLEIEEGYGDTLNVLKDLISKLKGVASFKIYPPQNKIPINVV